MRKPMIQAVRLTSARMVSAVLVAALFMARAVGAEPGTPNPGLRYYYPTAPANPPRTIKVDVCVYGGTPGGVAAAVQAQRMGKTAALAVFRRHVGGMTSGGLTAVDLGVARSIGGIASEFLEKASQARLESTQGGSPELGFRPSQAEAIFRAMLDDAKVPVLFEHRLAEVKKDGTRITAITFEGGDAIEAKMFVDATYEGDFMARAGVRYFVGREGNAAYGETLNGFQIAKTHQFRFPIDPYRKAGDPQSGLLPGITGGPTAEAGADDGLVQAYNFRMWAVKAAEGLPWPKPAGYNRDDFALLERYLTTDPNAEWKFTYTSGPVKLNLGDCNNAGPISSDFVGASNPWPTADYATRERIFQAHVAYQQGMMWFLANDEAVPERVRAYVQGFGLPKNEFVETGGWPHELYIREARRMVSDYVMTEKNCRRLVDAEDPVGLASYQMDSHHTSRVVVDGVVKAEGCIEGRITSPYPVSYRSIVPREAECTNLLVPVCLSSTHVSYGSIRMEPVFMLLGQSAATAASLALDGEMSVQKVDYAKLRARLIADGQKLDWPVEPAASKRP